MKRIVLALLVLPGVLACDGDRGPAGPGNRPPLAVATWHVHAADGQPLPALVGHALVDGRLQQTFLDSARLTVGADGRWEEAVHLVTWQDGELVGSWARQDVGAWTPSDSGYVFTSDVRGRRHLLPGGTPDSLRLILKIEGLPGVSLATARATPPAPAITGARRATHVGGQPLPARLYLIDLDTLYGQPVSVHMIVDSAFLAVHANGRYVHRVWVSEWIGQPGGPPTQLNARLSHNDHGEWLRGLAAVQFESAWLQNHRMTGTIGADGVLRMQHGFTHGDPPAEFRYR